MLYKILTTISILIAVVVSLSFKNIWNPALVDWKIIDSQISNYLIQNNNDDYVVELIRYSDNGIFYYEVIENGIRKGFLVTAKAPSKYNNFDFFVILNLNFKIEYLEIMKYRENWGYEITNKKWLRQFSKLTDSSFGSENQVQAISGATISVHSLCSYIDVILEDLKNI
jgi:hypothetical protein|tara:strand:- start:1494 stop:2000 length:507 start_codon:yes stop_codon:yes gene_type:complete